MVRTRPDPDRAQTIGEDPATVVVRTERFEEMLRPLLREAFSMAQAMLLDRHEAEDAVQDAALSAWRSFGQFRDQGGGLRPWFLKIVANQCRSRLRSRWWQVWRRAELRGGAGATAEDGVVLRADLARALGRLSMDQREVLFLVYQMDLPYVEAARILGLRLGTLKSRVHRATFRLRQVIDEEATSGLA